MLSVVPHGELMGMEAPLPNWPCCGTTCWPSRVEAAAPVIRLDGLLEHGSALKGLQVRRAAGA